MFVLTGFFWVGGGVESRKRRTKFKFVKKPQISPKIYAPIGDKIKTLVWIFVHEISLYPNFYVHGYSSSILVVGRVVVLIVFVDAFVVMYVLCCSNCFIRHLDKISFRDCRARPSSGNVCSAQSEAWETFWGLICYNKSLQAWLKDIYKFKKTKFTFLKAAKP